MSDTYTGVNIGGGFFSMLTILFIAFKLTDIISWSWFWVLSPILLPLIIIGFIVVVILLYHYLTD